MVAQRMPDVHRSPSPEERRSGAFVLGVVGVMGVVYALLLMFSWRVPGSRPLDRWAFVWVLGLAGMGLILFGEGGRVARWRRLALCVSLGGVAVLPLAWRAEWAPLWWGWLCLVVSGLCVGGECSLLLRLWHVSVREEKERPSLRVLLVLLCALVFPSLWLPYVGVVPGSLMYCVVAAGVSLWMMPEAVRRRWAWGFGFVPACCVGMVWWFPGVFVAEKGHLPVDASVVRPSLQLMTSRRMDNLIVRDAGWSLYTYDAHRWAEALVHPTLFGGSSVRSVLLMGGETGIELREILRYPGVSRVEVWTHRRHRLHWFRKQPLLSRLHQKSFADPRVVVREWDTLSSMYRALHQYADARRFDRVIASLSRPWVEPSVAPTLDDVLGLFRRALRRDGELALWWGELRPVVSFACLLQTARRKGWYVRPYRSESTGLSWAMAMMRPDGQKRRIGVPVGLRYIRRAMLPSLFSFPPDVSPSKVGPHACQDATALE